ncbi:hypothetical protein AB3S75_004922 [Citrus x aurantiifolia]
MLDAGAESYQYHWAGNGTKITTGRFQYPYQRKRLKKKKERKEKGQHLATSPKRNPNFQYLADVDFENPAFGSLDS